jgi:hypothetical protein
LLPAVTGIFVWIELDVNVELWQNGVPHRHGRIQLLGSTAGMLQQISSGEDEMKWNH